MPAATLTFISNHCVNMKYFGLYQHQTQAHFAASCELFSAVTHTPIKGDSSNWSAQSVEATSYETMADQETQILQEMYKPLKPFRLRTIVYRRILLNLTDLLKNHHHQAQTSTSCTSDEQRYHFRGLYCFYYTSLVLSS